MLGTNINGKLKFLNERKFGLPVKGSFVVNFQETMVSKCLEGLVGIAG